MTRVIMHGCNGRMGQVISGLAAEDGEVQLIRRAETPEDYFATFDGLDIYSKFRFGRR